MRRYFFLSVSVLLICFSASVIYGERDVRTYTYTVAPFSTVADETAGVVTILPGQCRNLTKSFTFDSVTASRITKLTLEVSRPNFMDFEMLDVTKSGNTFQHEYRICVHSDAPSGLYQVEMTFIFRDDLDSEVARRSHTEHISTQSGVPTTPTSLSATPVSTSRIDLSWQDRSSNETGFKIERSLSSSSGFSQLAVVGVNATSFSNTGLSPSTTYYYRVRAYNSSGNSGYSNTTSATTQGTGDSDGDSCSQATDMSLNSSRNAGIDFPGDLDYFRISVPAEGELRAFSSGSTDTYGFLRSSMCTSLEEDDDSGEGLNFRIERDVTPGTYYISVRHLSSSGTGSYTLNVEFYPDDGDSIIYPQLALGGGYEVALFLSNATTTSWNGTVFLNRGNNQEWDSAWTLNGIDRTGSSSFDVYLGPNATQKFLLTSKTDVRAGYLRITGKGGARITDISTSFFYDVTVNGQLIDSIGTPPGIPSRHFTCPVERNDEALTGFAWAPESPISGFPIYLALYDSAGNLIRSVTVTFEGHVALFFHEVFDNFPDNFVGKVVVESQDEIHLTVLRLCWTQSGFQLTSVPPTSE